MLPSLSNLTSRNPFDPTPLSELLEQARQWERGTSPIDWFRERISDWTDLELNAAREQLVADALQLRNDLVAARERHRAGRDRRAEVAVNNLVNAAEYVGEQLAVVQDILRARQRAARGASDRDGPPPMQRERSRDGL